MNPLPGRETRSGDGRHQDTLDGPRLGPPCPDSATWERIRTTAGAAADARFHEHVEGCPACLDRLERIAAEWSRDELVGTVGRGRDQEEDPAASMCEQASRRDAPRPLPAIEGLADPVEIGRGGMGIVYRADDRRLGRRVAVKVLTTAAALSPEGRARAEREARLLSRVTHPNIVRVWAVTEADGLPVITMEWIDGESLSEARRRGALTVDEAVAVVRDLAGAVAAIHAVGVIHRDIKPANVLLARGEGEARAIPKLVDFGLARHEADGARAVTRSNATVGTPAFMAPEQTGLVPALGPVGPATDIHALGALLYWLLSGRAPYEDRTPLATLQRAATADCAPLSKLVPALPADVATIIATCLMQRPEQRYASAGALADDLGRFLSGLPIRARRPGPSARMLRWCRRHPLAAAIAVATVLATVATAVGIAHHVRALERAEKTLTVTQTEALASAALARQSFARLTDSTAERLLVRGAALDEADRDHLRAVRARYRDWPLEPDEAAALHFRAAGLFRLANLFRSLRWQEETLETARDHRQALLALERLGIATAEEVSRGHLVRRIGRAILAGSGRVDEAIEEARSTIADLENRLAAEPALELHLAVCQGDLGNYLGITGDHDGGRVSQEKALATLDRLIAAAPDDADLARQSLTILYNTVLNPAFAADPAARRALLEKLVDRSEQGLERFRSDPTEFGRGLTMGLGLQIDADLGEGRPREALEKARRRADTARRLSEETAHRQGFLDEVISAAAQSWRCHLALGRPADARAAVEEADGLASRALALEPAVHQRTWVLVEILLARGALEEATAGKPAAIAVYERLLAALAPWGDQAGPGQPFQVSAADVRAEIERLRAEAAVAGRATVEAR